MDWKTIELLGYSYFSEKGYRILVSLIDNSVYDFVIEKDNIFKTVNVKMAGLKDKNKKNSWSISNSGTSMRGTATSDLDIYLVWLPHQSRFIELEGTFFEGVNSTNRLIPKRTIE